ncbi:hypothetical protein BJ742DRAFT_678466, partial [Cladochytrium replicatum]
GAISPLASSEGHVDVLEWWKQSELQLEWTESAMDKASMRARIDVLNWWRDSGLELRWSTRAMDHSKNVDVLEWWKSNGLDLMYDVYSIDLASQGGDNAKLEWWKNSGLELRDERRWTMQVAQDVSMSLTGGSKQVGTKVRGN